MNKTKKVKKREWQKVYKGVVFNHFNGVCQRCKRECISIDQGVCHHNTYKNVDGKSVYAHDAIFLINKDVITWVCIECHKYIHHNSSIDGGTKLIGKCVICNKNYTNNTRGLTIGRDEPICRPCFRYLKNQE